MVELAILSRAPKPGTGWIVARGTKSRWEWEPRGTSNRERQVIDEHTLFDLASLTKVLITVPLSIKVMADGLIAPESKVGSLLTWLDRSPVGDATVAQLLTHTSGAPAEVSLDRGLDEALVDLELSRPGSIEYSDAGFIVLGRVLESVTGNSLATLARDHAADLGAGREQVEFVAVAPDRWADTGVSTPGAVHDPAARKAARLLGHAGCFATVAGTQSLLRFWLEPNNQVSSLVTTAMNQQSRVGGARGWGWALQNDSFACAPGWPENSVSHTGFTGTAIAFDPHAGDFVFVISNAVADGSGASLRWLRSIMTELAPSQTGSSENGTVWA